jgi:hypothetical protein
MTQERTHQEATPGAGTATVTIAELQCEHRRDALGIGLAQPRL